MGGRVGHRLRQREGSERKPVVEEKGISGRKRQRERMEREA